MSAAHNAESHSLNQRARSVQLVMAVTWAGPGGPGSRRRGYVGASATAWAQEAGRAVARSIVTPMWAATQEHSLAPHNTTNSPRPWPVDAAPDRRGFGTRAGGGRRWKRRMARTHRQRRDQPRWPPNSGRRPRHRQGAGAPRVGPTLPGPPTGFRRCWVRERQAPPLARGGIGGGALTREYAAATRPLAIGARRRAKVPPFRCGPLIVERRHRKRWTAGTYANWPMAWFVP